MRQQYLALAAVFVVAGASLASAQRFGGPDGDRGPQPQQPQLQQQRWQPSADDMDAFADARIAGMKAGLRLTSDQEKNWPAFEQAYRGLAKLRAERRADRANATPPKDVVEMMQRRADTFSRSATAFKQFADATAPLYQSLDDTQKQRFSVLAQILQPRRVITPGEHRMGPRGFGSGERFRQHGFDRERFGGGFGAFRTGLRDGESGLHLDRDLADPNEQAD